MKTLAKLEIGTFSKDSKQGSVPIPSTAEMSLYQDVRHRVSLVQAFEDDGPVAFLRVEAITQDQHATAIRPNYRVAIDIPLEGNVARMIEAAADHIAHNNIEKLDKPSLADVAGFPEVGKPSLEDMDAYPATDDSDS